MRDVPPVLMKGQGLTFPQMALEATCNHLLKFSLKSSHSHNEHKKQRMWDERNCEVEFGLSSSVIFSSISVCGIISKSLYKRLATLIASKYLKLYNNDTINYVHCRISFFFC